MDGAAAVVCGGGIFLFFMLFIVLMIASMWKIFEKAGQPGWAAIVPIYNGYVLTVEIAKKEIIWFILQFVPFVGIVAAFVVCIELAKKFGKEAGYGIGIALLPFVFLPMLAFGDARYQGGRGGSSRRRDDYYDDDDDDYEDEPKPRRGSRGSRRRDDDDD